MSEPSILDYLRSLCSRETRINLGDFFSSSQGPSQKELAPQSMKERVKPSVILWVIVGSSLAVFAQILLEPPNQRVLPALFLYCISAFTLYQGLNVPSISLESRFDAKNEEKIPGYTKRTQLFIAALLLVMAFFLFNENRFTLVNTCIWLVGSGLLINAFWVKTTEKENQEKRTARFFLVLVTAFLLAAFFRFYRLNQVPSEMFSDHAEKLLDVMDVLDGETRIFFPRNTGREGLQFYLTAAIISLFHTGIGFLSLKIGTAIAGFLTLPFIYLIGRTIDSRWVGLTAVVFAGFSYWHNVISRIGLRFPLYPLFISIMMYFLFKGLKKRNINDIILSAIATGIGLHGYSPFRVAILMFVVIILLYWIIERKGQSDAFLIRSVCIFILIVLAIFLPLMRYMFEFPASFHYRALSRITSIEQSIEGSVWIIFLKNLWKSLTMMFYHNGVIWVNSIPNRPALDFVSASFFFVGLIVIFKRIQKFKQWEDLVLVNSIPILMLPSVLSIAYPQENPALNRSSGAIIPIFLITALGFKTVFKMILDSSSSKHFKVLSVLCACFLIGVSARENYNLVFRQFDQQYTLNAWNSSEIGETIPRFVAEGNSSEHAFVVPYPHWVDTRLVGINAGFPRKDFALWREQIPETRNLPGRKLFILKPEDLDGLDAVELCYPDAKLEIYHSKVPGKDFFLVYVADR